MVLIKGNRRRLATALLIVTVFLAGIPAAYGAGFDQSQPYQGTNTTPVTQNEQPSTLWLTLRVVGSLAVVVLGAYYGLRFMQKKMASGTSVSSWMRVVDRLSLSPNKGLMITEIGGRFFVIGVTDQSIQKIMEIEDPALIDELLQEQQESDEVGPEDNWLKRLKGMLTPMQGVAPQQPPGERLDFRQEMGRQISRLSRLTDVQNQDSISSRGREEDQ